MILMIANHQGDILDSTSFANWQKFEGSEVETEWAGQRDSRMRSYESASAASGTGRNFISHDNVRKQCAMLNNQLTQLVDLKREAVSALDGISGLARNIDNSLRPVKEATEGLSRSLANIEKVSYFHQMGLPDPAPAPCGALGSA